MYHLGMPTSPFGDEDLDKAYAKIDNPLIKQSLNVKKHPEEPHFPNEYSLKGAPYGRVYEKFPFKYKVEKDKAYLWCSCGYSINQVINYTTMYFLFFYFFNFSFTFKSHFVI